MSDTSYSNELFNVLIERSERLTSLVLKYVPNDKPITILDLGCGTGDQALALADALPQARIIGLDISRPNIELAEQKRREHHACDRIHFMETDYMHFVHEPFDVIFSWGVLHLIPVPTAKLCAKLARDLKPNGLFLNTMPYDC